MNRTFEEWVALFEKKVQKIEWTPHATLFFSPTKGFCEIIVSDKMVIIGNACGNANFFKKFTEHIAKQIGVKVCGAIFGRSAFRAWLRLLHFRIDKIDEDKNNLKRYHCTGENGGWGTLSESILEDGRKNAFFTWEVK